MAPQRLRVRPPTIVGMLAAVLLVAALVATGRWQAPGRRLPSPSTARPAAADAPYRLDGGWRCPLGRPVLAMADGRSYPPGHPARPPREAGAASCHRTVAEAAAAGYPPAPLPAGALVVGGVYLAPTDRAFRSRCQAAANRLGFAVPCPGLLPTWAPETVPPELCGRRAPCDRYGGFLLRQAGFAVPPGYFGVDKQAFGSLELTAASGGEPSGDFACETERPIATVRVQGRRAVLVGCPGWSSSGQVTLRWTQAGTHVTVSLQGASAVNRQLLLALANHLRLVRPRPDRRG